MFYLVPLVPNIAVCRHWLLILPVPMAPTVSSKLGRGVLENDFKLSDISGLGKGCIHCRNGRMVFAFGQSAARFLIPLPVDKKRVPLAPAPSRTPFLILK